MLLRLKSVTVSIVLFTFAYLISPSGAAEKPNNGNAGEPDISLTLRRNAPAQSDWFYNALAVNYIALNTLDLITTYKSLEKGAVEVNPVARHFIDKKPMAIAFKTGLTGGVLFALGKMKKQDKKAAYITLGLLNVVYGIVVANNVGVYMQLN